MADNDEFDNEQIRPYIIACHGPLEDLRPVLESEPRLLRSCWHWGGGDWESGMDAAGHMGHPDVARFLMDRGATLHAYAAASMGLTDVVRSMVEADPKVVNRPGVHGMSMLLHVSMSGDTELAGYLHQQGATLGIDSALHGAIAFGHEDMVRWILDHGAEDLQVSNFEGKSPLRAAEEKGLDSMVRLLKSRGAS